MRLETWDEYTEAAARTLPTDLDTDQLAAMLALGLVCEAGEVGDIVKKVLFHGHTGPDPREHLAEELGDVCWYLANLMRLLGLDLDTVLAANVAKLERRYPNGFSSERSQQRSED